MKPKKTEKQLSDRAKKIWKITGIIAGHIFDVECLCLSIAYFLNTIVYFYNQRLLELNVYPGHGVVDTIPNMMSEISGMATFVVFLPLQITFMGMVLRLFSHFARNRKPFSFLANTIFLSLAGYMLSITPNINTYNSYLRLLLIFLAILYATNNGKIIFDLCMKCYKKHKDKKPKFSCDKGKSAKVVSKTKKK